MGGGHLGNFTLGGLDNLGNLCFNFDTLSDKGKCLFYTNLPVKAICL